MILNIFQQRLYLYIAFYRNFSIHFKKNNIKYSLERTRDEERITKADYVFDVGGIYDPSINRFDHHQPGGAGKRENDIPYAAFGLVWKTYGPILCENNEEIINDLIII